jgi:DNA-binding NarL/FixJ family response regulator
MTNGVQLNVLIADEHPVTREGVKALLHAIRETAVARVEEASDGDQLMRMLRKKRYDLLILDVFLANMDGLKVLEQIQQEGLRLATIVFSRYDNQRMRKAVMIRGADGFALKSASVAELEKAIRTVLKGRKYSHPPKERHEQVQLSSQGTFQVPFQERCSLTRREIQILQLIAQSKSNKDIAKSLFISAQTVSVHRKNLMRKLGVQNKASLVRAAYEYQLLE